MAHQKGEPRPGIPIPPEDRAERVLRDLVNAGARYAKSRAVERRAKLNETIARARAEMQQMQARQCSEIHGHHDAKATEAIRRAFENPPFAPDSVEYARWLLALRDIAGELNVRWPPYRT